MRRVDLLAARAKGEAHPLGGWLKKIDAWAKHRLRPTEPISLSDICRELGFNENEIRGRAHGIRWVQLALNELQWLAPKGRSRVWTPPSPKKPPPFIAPEHPAPDVFAERRQALANVLDGIIASKLFPEQLAAIQDCYPRVALFTPRRSGKTTVGAYKIARDAMLWSARKFLFIGLYGATAENSVYEVMLDVLRELGEPNPEKSYNQVKRVFTLENKSTIRLVGLNAKPEEQEKTLGGKYHGIAIDECQSQAQNLEGVIDLLGPAVADYILEGGGWIWMLGTPGDLMGEHYWWRVTKQDREGRASAERVPGWHVHTWNVTDNPFMKLQFEADVARDREAWGSDDFMLEPSWQRKWLGRWVLELRSKVYRYVSEKNAEVANDVTASLGRGALSGVWTFSFGVDLGWEDATAVVVAAWRQGERRLYFARSEKRRHATYEEIGAWLTEWALIYRPVRVVIDSGGGASKQLAMSLQTRYQLAVVAAGKTEKKDHVARMNADFATGAIHVVEGDNKELLTEWSEHVLDPKKREQGIWAEYDGTENHLCDAALYAWRDAQHHSAVLAAPKPELSMLDKIRARKRQERSANREGDRGLAALEQSFSKGAA